MSNPDRIWKERWVSEVSVSVAVEFVRLDLGGVYRLCTRAQIAQIAHPYLVGNDGDVQLCILCP